LTAALGAALLALLAAAPKPKVVLSKPVPAAAPAPVASVRILDGTLQRGRGLAWRDADRDFRISPGESLRTSADGAALLTFPWMQILVGGDAVVGLTPSTVLSVTLERGRVQERATAGDILKVVTAEGEVRGRGDVVVTRSDVKAETRVSALSGWFRVRSPRGMVSLDAGQGAIVTAAGTPEIVDLPAPPTGLDPGSDPRYVEQGRSARLGWTGSAPRYRAQVLSLSGDETVLSREVEGTSLEVPGRWLGTFRWRVSSIDARGVEGPPSVPGLFCVVEK
jgi:hypothetical protein